MELIFLVILAALIFEYINGFHDTANSIATVVSTKVLTPRQAVVLAAMTNLAGAMLGTAVAKTISSGLVDAKVVTITSELLVCALAGAITWNLITWWFGMPSSSSHALIGGLCGAALAAAQGDWKAIIWSQPDPANWVKSGGLLYKVILPMFSSPLGGFLLGFLIMGLLYLVITLAKLSPRIVNMTFGKAQILSAGAMGVMHGTNDAQKTMGIIALALMAGTATGTFDNLPGWLRWLYYPEQGAAIQEAYNRLGEMARDGRGLPQSNANAVRDLTHAAKNKNLNAQYNLGLLYWEGKGVPANYKEAASLVEKAAEKGHHAAQLKLAQFYKDGIGVTKDAAKAEAWLALAATNQNVVPKTPFAFRKIKEQPANSVEALAWLRAKAEKNNADAQVNLGVIYATGKGVPENMPEALRWFEKAAAFKHPDALFNMGLMHALGKGAPQNNTEAAKWFHAAAKTEGIKLWIKVICALVMAAGTAAGGWRIIKTLGHKMVKLQPINGFAAETSSATMIFLATTLGIPVSTTHNISAAIMGVGCARRFNAIKWPVVERMVWAWVLTIPITGALAYLLVRCSQFLGWIK
jgi:phosphate/sulfate permease